MNKANVCVVQRMRNEKRPAYAPSPPGVFLLMLMLFEPRIDRGDILRMQEYL
jgi:hypothetical protein